MLALFCLMLLTSCSVTLPETVIPASRTYKRKLDIRANGFRRNYLIHIPQGCQPYKPVPLLIVLHGGFSTAKEMEKQTGFSDVADRENFIVVYPNGAYGIFGFLQHWNAGFCCGKAASDKLDDVTFIEAVIWDVKERFNIDSSRIYITGYSNGGMLVYRFAAEKSGLIAAAAPVAASLGGRSSENDPMLIIPKPEFPVPIICFHGINDSTVPFNGGKTSKHGRIQEYLSVEESMEFWRKVNGCQQPLTTEILYAGKIIRSTCEDTTGKYSVILYALKDWDHQWPGKTDTGKFPKTDPIVGFDAAEIIWNFLNNYRRE